MYTHTYAYLTNKCTEKSQSEHIQYSTCFERKVSQINLLVNLISDEPLAC